MSDSGERVPRVLAIDAGGTMTDTFIVDERGSFVVGKAQTTPEDESIGFMASARDALGQWDSTPEEGFPPIVSGIYSGTAMLNRLLQRQGLKIGCIVNAGHEDYLRLERGIQTYLGYSYSDRLHVATHFHNEPLVPRAADEGCAWAHRRVRRRGPAAARAGRVRGGDRAARRRRATASSSRCSSPTATPQHEMRVAEIIERGEGQARRQRRGPGLPLLASSTRCGATCRD